MHPISLIFLGLCAFLVGFWLVRKLEKRKLESSGPPTKLSPMQPVPAPSTHSTEPHQASTPVSAAHPGAKRESSAVENGDIRDLILANQKVEAIKLLHEQRGWDLQHAKEYVEQQEQQQSSRDLNPEVIAEARRLLAENRKIVAIKLIYDHTGWSLKAAKDYVENSL